jgi:pyridoxal phosphate enzyme (YggS family)
MFQYENAWQDARLRVAAAARESGREPRDIRLLAVSKTFPPTALRAVYALGQRAFGENYVQEAIAKMDALADLGDVEWHLIGPLQSNKTAAVAARFAWVHTVERAKTAARLSAARSVTAPPLNVCVQVNISGEATKSGVRPDEVVALAQSVAALPRLRLRGLMGIAGANADTASSRAQFQLLARCHDSVRAAGLAVDTLSMGMSGDLEAAIAEGATLVRLGTAIFGARGAAA